MLTVGAFIFEGFEALDLAGPLVLLRKAAKHAGRDDVRFVTVAEGKDKPVLSAQMFSLWPDHDFESCPYVDLLLLPGGIGTLSQIYKPKHLEFLKRCSAKAQRMASVCSGSAAFAAAGLLDGKKATTNKATWDMLTNLPTSSKTQWVHEARFVIDGKMYTSSGVSAGVDLGFVLSVELFGEPAARAATAEIGHVPADSTNDPFSKIDYKFSPPYKWIMTTGVQLFSSLVVADTLKTHQKKNSGWPFGTAKPVIVVLVPDDGFEFLDVANAGEIFGAEDAALKLEYVGLSPVKGSAVMDSKLSAELGVVSLKPHATVSSAKELFSLHSSVTCIVIAGSINGSKSSCLAIAEDVVRKARERKVPHVILAGELGKATKAADFPGLQVVPSGMPVATAALDVVAALKGPKVAKNVAAAAELVSDYVRTAAQM
ncbi:hypothetical protein HDU96_008670 [Phlyctochytrium bullatum]|nr:hypothetical protein HDU96_008670 [Phlyctochytrium bullatum]